MTLNLVFLLHCLFYSGSTARRYDEKYMKLKTGETRELASILQSPNFPSIYSKLGSRKASKQTNNNKTSHISAGTYDQFHAPQPPPFPFPFISHGWEEQKKAAGFWTIKRKIESRSLAGNIKCKKHTECKLEQDKGRKNIYKASARWGLTFFI